MINAAIFSGVSFFFRCTSRVCATVKILKIRTPEKVAVITLKFEGGFTGK